MNEIDRELVGRLMRGERAAFDEFFNEYYPKLYRFVKRRMPPTRPAAKTWRRQRCAARSRACTAIAAKRRS